MEYFHKNHDLCYKTYKRPLTKRQKMSISSKPILHILHRDMTLFIAIHIAIHRLAFDNLQNFHYICAFNTAAPPNHAFAWTEICALTPIMKAKKIYRISIEDESRLRQIVSVSASPYVLWICGIAIGLLLVAIASILIIITPLHTMMPGYLKKGERTEAEQGLLRIDSISEAFRLNNIYLSNILTVLDTDRTPTDSVITTTSPNELPPDSLLPTSPREIEFISQMKDKEQYNVTILAPLAAEQLKTYPVAAGAVVEEKSQNAIKARILTPKRSPACAITDGRVLAIQNPAPEGGSAIVMQHDNGFASRYSHLGTPTVTPGTHVDGGSVIAHGASGGALSPGYFFLEMWYDGTPVEPARYLQGNNVNPNDEPYMLSGRPMGR